MKKSLSVRILALALAVMLLFAGCGGGGTADTSSVSSGDEGQQSGDATDIMSIPMPTRDLSDNDKVLTIFSWSSMEENAFDGEAAEYFQKEFGVKIDVTISTHATYFSDYQKAVAADMAPDIIDLENAKFYPAPVAKNLFQTWEGHIDFSTPLWADVQDLIDRYKWKDKIYYPCLGKYVYGWLYYNKSMFTNYGLEDSTPRALYEKGEWTLDKMAEVATQFIEKDNKNNVKQYGLVQQEYDPLFIAGIPIVEVQNGTSYTNNLNDPKIAKIMNTMINVLSPGKGNNAWHNADCTSTFVSEKAAMCFNYQTILSDGSVANMMNDGNLGIAPNPKLDGESKHYVTMAVDPGYGLSNVTGANTELAALYVEYLKWFKLGDHLCRAIPSQKNHPAKEKYDLKPVSRAAYVSEEDIAWIDKFLADENTEEVFNDFNSYVNDMGDFSLWKDSIFVGLADWSQQLKIIYPRYEAQLKEYIK